MFHFIYRRAFAGAVLASALLACAIPLQLVAENAQASGTSKASHKVNTKAKAKSAASGLAVAVDPQTRKLRQPTPEELRALRASSPAQSQSRVAGRLTHSSGARGVKLSDATDNFLVVTKTPDGKLKMSEFAGKDAADSQVKKSGREASK